MSFKLSTEYFVPYIMGILLRTSQLVCVTPVRLRRVCGRWGVRISPGLIMFQRLVVFLTNSVVIVELALSFLGFDRLYEQNTTTVVLSSMMLCSQLILPMITYSLGVLSSPRQVKNNLILLRRLQKINKTLCGVKKLKSESNQLLSCLLFVYILWQFVTYSSSMINYVILICGGRNVCPYIIIIEVITYQNVVSAFLQLQWSLIVDEIRFSVSMLNEELETWLGTPKVTGIPNFKNNFISKQKKFKNKISIISSQGIILHPTRNIRYISDCYNEINEMIREIDSDYGPYMVLLVTLLSLRLLITSHNSLIAMETKNTMNMFWQGVWSLLHITQLLSLVEPGHRLQDQLELTRRRVSKLSRSSRRDLDPVQLEELLMQVQVKAALAPMKMFTIARPLVVSIVGGVATTLVMITQFRKVSEHA